MYNPFHWRGMITSPTAFVGREYEFKNIASRLRGLGCVSVVGPRRVGKSSLLYQACQRTESNVGSDCQAVYIDALSAQHHTAGGLLGAILEGLGEDGARVMAESPVEALAEFERAIREVRSTGCMPVVFLDEFEYLARHSDRFGDSLLESWRSLCNSHHMAFVTASKMTLNRITGDAGWTSTFYNVFSQVKLSEFTEQEASQFARWAAGVGGFPSSDEAFLLRVGKRHPCRLQVTAWHLFEERQAGEPDFETIEKRVNEDMEGMLGQA